ncbi:hypothetical protein CAPTEDRAFT_227402 [Capitella teleta]|uniref:poly(ADP-ribose) glycohydrolase n=1 Tax=Capitella teleta TaxID=283909 RepID=R7UZ60_CAPTE|nr:hypothetical protein CAPTEDRAFT_227402 [Capitella teleta]|eukprot:ELU08701.1 hypothetical protein CAPTEDRAFT_227402 [Capitella teleta]
MLSFDVDDEYRSMSKEVLPRFKKQTSLKDFWGKKGTSSNKRPVEDSSCDGKSTNKKLKSTSEPIVSLLKSDPITEKDRMSGRNSFPGSGKQCGHAPVGSASGGGTEPQLRSEDSIKSTASYSETQHDHYGKESIENGASDERCDDEPNCINNRDSSIKEKHMGTPISEFPRTPECIRSISAEQLPSADLGTTNAHQRLVKLPESEPTPKELHDIWNTEHVKMPYSTHNMYMTDDRNKRKVSRWDLIEEALAEPIRTFQDLENAILHYNSLNKDKWDLYGLRYFIESIKPKERSQFFDNVLPFMKKLVLDSQKIITEPPRLLKKGKVMSVTMSQEQAACLLANAFFCTFPYRSRRKDEYSNFPEMNFVNLFAPYQQDRKFEKLKCLFYYFKARNEKTATNSCITFRRQVLKDPIEWEYLDSPLKKLHVSAVGNIEDDGEGMLQVDFANKYVGGGVLGRGLVQEEIRFIICPEMIVSRLLTEELDDNECLLMTGCQRYSDYAGYSDSFKCLGPYEDKTLRDENGQLLTEVVAIDALVARSFINQFNVRHLNRELNKAYCGFMNPHIPDENKSAVATGNWGCGAFGGDVYVKALIQLMAASAAKRSVCYFTFGDSRLMEALHKMHELLWENKVSVGELYRYLVAFHKVGRHDQSGEDLFIFVRRKVSNEDDIDQSPNYDEETP